MSPPTPLAVELARTVLAYELGSPELPLGVAVENCHQRLHHALVNLVGEAGFAALLGRAAQLTRPVAKWIELVVSPASATFSVAELTAIAQREGVPQVLEGMTMWLANVFGLLCTFIGEDLTLRLVRRTWTQGDALASSLGEVDR